MPFVAQDHATVYAIDAAIKASDMQQMDQNIDYLKGLFDPSTGHPHDGSADGGPLITSVADNAITQSKIAASAVGQGELKTAQGAVSVSSSNVNLTLPGGEYGFYPRLKAPGANLSLHMANGGSFGSYVTNVAMNVTAGTGYAQQRYFQASPPYMLGSKKWGHFLYLLRRISDGVVVASYEAEDPCWAYNGPSHMAKDSAERISAVPHPFADYWQKDPAVDGLEVVLVDLSITNTKKWISDNRKVGKGILEDVGTVLIGKGTSKAHSDYSIPAIPNFTDRVKIVTP